jgi:hypothetical protein
MKRTMCGNWREWLKRNIRARPAYMDWFLYAAFTGAGLLASALGRAYGWWPESYLGEVAVYLSISAVLGVPLILLGRASRQP